MQRRSLWTFAAFAVAAAIVAVVIYAIQPERPFLMRAYAASVVAVVGLGLGFNGYRWIGRRLRPPRPPSA